METELVQSAKKIDRAQHASKDLLGDAVSLATELRTLLDRVDGLADRDSFRLRLARAQLLNVMDGLTEITGDVPAAPPMSRLKRTA